MTPPITVHAFTNNLDKCGFRLVGADGSEAVVQVPSTGNVYQGLHAAKDGLEAAINAVLAFNGVVPVEPAPETQEPPPASP